MLKIFVEKGKMIMEEIPRKNKKINVNKQEIKELVQQAIKRRTLNVKIASVFFSISSNPEGFLLLKI